MQGSSGSGSETEPLNGQSQASSSSSATDKPAPARRPIHCGVPVVAPGLVARRREVERARVKDTLRHFVGSVWGGQVRLRGESVRRAEEMQGVGRVWRLRRFWERVARGEGVSPSTSAGSGADAGGRPALSE